MFGQAQVDWTQIILQGITTGGIIATAFIAAWMNRRMTILHQQTTDLHDQTAKIRDEIKIPSGDTIGQAIEKTHDLAATNHAQLIIHGEHNSRTATIASESAAQTDGQLKEIHGLVNDRLEAALQKIDDLRAELQVLRGRRTGG